MADHFESGINQSRRAGNTKGLNEAFGRRNVVGHSQRVGGKSVVVLLSELLNGRRLRLANRSTGQPKPYEHRLGSTTKLSLERTALLVRKLNDSSVRKVVLTGAG